MGACARCGAACGHVCRGGTAGAESTRLLLTTMTHMNLTLSGATEHSEQWTVLLLLRRGPAVGEPEYHAFTPH
eukprot:5748924-Prymnesium_polylepis.1